MVFNHCIYGTINKPGKLICYYYNYSIDETYSKELDVVDSYQFNLGDFDMKGINSNISQGDIVLLEYYDVDKEYSTKCVLDLSNNIQEFNIDVNLPFIETDSVANFKVSENIIKTSNYKLNEDKTELYNYFEIKDLDADIIKYKSNESLLYFVPTESHEYSILERSINETTNTITEKEYTFNAIVGSSAITRSNKCKSINDAIKILLQGFDNTLIATIDIIKDDTLIESGTMSLDSDNLYSYNYSFPSVGYFCFVVNYGDETFLVDFRVEQNNFKVYYSEEDHIAGELINYEYYSLEDVYTVLGSGTFNNIANGIYSSDLLAIPYGDYLFKVLGNDFVTSFEECGGSSEEQGDSTITGNAEEVYWIFPNNLGD